MADRRDRLQVLIRNGRTFEVTHRIDQFLRCRYEYRARNVASAQIELAASSVDKSSGLYRQLRSGALLDIQRTWLTPEGEVRIDQWIGPVQRIDLRRDLGAVRTIRGPEVVNEVITLGDEDQSCRLVGRAYDRTLQALHGTREVNRSYVGVEHKTQFTRVEQLVAYSAGTLQDHVDQQIGGSGDFAKPSENTRMVVHARDAWEWAAARVVDTYNLDFVYPGGESAGEWIANLLERELIAPRIERRAGPAGLRVRSSDAGPAVPLTVRWEPVMEAIQTVCRYADLSIGYEFDPRELTLTLTTRPFEDRTSGDRRIVLSTDRTDSDVDVEHGQRVLLAFDADVSDTPEEFPVPVLGKRVELAPGRQTEVTLDWGRFHNELSDRDAILTKALRDAASR